MADVRNIPGLEELWSLTQGDRRICVAVLDGLVDRDHACFRGAKLDFLPTGVKDEPLEGSMARHGTHVTSVIFGQHDGPVPGISPGCKGWMVPVFSDRRSRLSQLDLSRGIEQAVRAGAHVINISGGQWTEEGEPEDWLDRAVGLCEENNVLLVAAAGNDGCPCVHVPAAVRPVLAVGAHDDEGRPLDFSNWGPAYQENGILAPGEEILGAVPGGGTTRMTGTSFATPIVSGVVALLLSAQLRAGRDPSPCQIRDVLWETTVPSVPLPGADPERHLLGTMSIPAALEVLQLNERRPQVTRILMNQTHVNASTLPESAAALDGVSASGCGCVSPSAPAQAAEQDESLGVAEAGVVRPATREEPPAAATPPAPVPAIHGRVGVGTAGSAGARRGSVNASGTQSDRGVNPSGVAGMVYVLGTLGYDFGTEARRDSFKQFMPSVEIAEKVTIPPNPYDARQMVDYLEQNPSEARSLIWTLSLELTPIYAIDPIGPYARDVHDVLVSLLAGEIEAEDDPDYIERVSIPGVLTDRTVRLFSGQIVPVIEPHNTRGVYGWKVNSLIDAALAGLRTERGEEGTDETKIRRSLGGFLNRIYYDLRNLGTTARDRALNFAATNAFQAASTFSSAVAGGMELDSITVEKSPFCRPYSDCWDVKLKFFDPENTRRARKVFRFTIDVNDMIPVTLGEVRQWSESF
jgi:cyanobactin maturation PatA/PatG family protease